MTINFQSLPQTKPAANNIIPKGRYEGYIANATMKTPKQYDNQPQKPDYLNLEIDVKDPATSKNMGKIWVIMTESPAALPRFQLARLIKALNLPITGDFELRDLAKMVNHKSLMLDICPEKNGKDAPRRSVVDVNAGQIFYPIPSEVGIKEPGEPTDADLAAAADLFGDPNSPNHSY